MDLIEDSSERLTGLFVCHMSVESFSIGFMPAYFGICLPPIAFGGEYHKVCNA